MYRESYSPSHAGEIELKKANKRLREEIKSAKAGIDSMNNSELAAYVESNGFESTNEHEDLIVAKTIAIIKVKRSFYSVDI